jgi:hydrogenase expression/formation protein HypD
VFCNHVLINPPLTAIMSEENLQLDGFIGPGHVATVVGSDHFEFVPRVSAPGLALAVLERQTR